MLAPTRGNRPYDGVAWAADNGCFATPELYSDTWYLNWLAMMREYRSTCLFATAPDVLKDAAATIEKSVPMFVVLRKLGYPPALVAQDGLESLPVPWSGFECLFLGGSTEWKLSAAAAALAKEAKLRGKWVHMGRVNSLTRLRIAKRMLCDSCDGNYVAFGPDIHGPKMGRWVQAVSAQQVIDF